MSWSYLLCVSDVYFCVVLHLFPLIWGIGLSFSAPYKVVSAMIVRWWKKTSRLNSKENQITNLATAIDQESTCLRFYKKICVMCGHDFITYILHIHLSLGRKSYHGVYVSLLDNFQVARVTRYPCVQQPFLLDD